MALKKEITPELVEKVRKYYIEKEFTQSEIRFYLDISEKKVRQIIREHGIKRGGEQQ